MNITRLNFADKLTFMKQVLNKCHFYSVDFEMSGTQVSERVRNSALDAAQSRYLKLKNSVQHYIPLQLGLCGFEYINNNQIKAYPFNIFMFPFSLSQGGMSKNFGFSTSSIRFLASHNFNFNDLFYDGIPYLSFQQFGFYKGQTQKARIKNQLKLINQSITPDMQAFKQLHFSTVSQWIQSSDAQQFNISIQYLKIKVYDHLLFSIRQKYPNIRIYQTFDNPNKFERTFMTLSKNQPPQYQQRSKIGDQDVQQLQKLPLLLKQFISQSNKPLIFHNGALDVIFIGRLPSTVSQFVRVLSKTFPHLWDTKFITNFSPVLFGQMKFRNSLSDCYKLLKNKPFPNIEIAEGFENYKLNNDNSQYHEAGFDALATGIVYSKALSQLKNISIKQGTKFEQIQKHLKNKIVLGGFTNYLDLKQYKDNYKSQQNVYYIQELIPSSIPQSSIHSYFQQHFGKVNIFPISNTSNHYNLRFQKQQGDNKINTYFKAQGNICLITISNSKFLLFKEDQYQKYSKGLQVRIQ